MYDGEERRSYVCKPEDFMTNMKKLYIISQEEDVSAESGADVGWNTYRSAVVCAESEEQARYIFSSTVFKIGRNGDRWGNDKGTTAYAENTWIDPKEVVVREIGIANDNIKIGEVLCNDFNAG